MDRNKFIDNLIAAGAEDDEIVEAMLLAESRGEFDEQVFEPKQPEPVLREIPKQQQDNNINPLAKVMSEPSYMDRVNADIERQGQKDVERQNAGGSKNLSEIAGKMQSMASLIRQAPGIYEAGQLVSAGFKKALPTIKKELPLISEAVKGTAGLIEKKTPANVKSIADIAGASAEIVPAVGVTSKIATPIAGAAGWSSVKTTGKIGGAIENTGKSIIARDAKIRDSIAKLAGKNPLKGVQKITDDISRYKVESTTGGFKGIASKAQKRIDLEMSNAEDAISNFAKKNPTATVDVDNTILQLADDIATGKEKSIFLNEDKAAELALSIQESLAKRGLAGVQPVSSLPEIKRAIDNGMNLFKKGSKNIEIDPLPSKVGELSYLRLNDELGSRIPEVIKANKAVHDLITVKEAMEQAQKLAGNRNVLGITDLALIFGGPQVAQALGAPGGAMLAGAPGAVLAAKKIAGDARGASGLIKTGRTIREASESVGKKINPLKKQKGSIGSAAEEFIGTPAIRDPKTGKIYQGGWRGHKDAIVKGETSEIQERLKHQHFLDNTNKPTSNVGFIDKSGNFISRSEAEKIMDKKLSSPSLVSQFHNVGIMAGTAAGAGGALTIGAAAANRNKRK